LRISEEEKKRKIVELYKSGSTYSYLQKRFHISSKSISKLVKGVEVKCAICGKLKGKTHFHAHHPDRDNQPNFTIPLCPSCHAKEEAEIRKQGRSPMSTPTIRLPTGTTKLTANPDMTAFPALGARKVTGRDIVIGIGLLYLLPKIWNDIQRHWEEGTPPSGRRAIMR